MEISVIIRNISHEHENSLRFVVNAIQWAMHDKMYFDGLLEAHLVFESTTLVCLCAERKS